MSKFLVNLTAINPKDENRKTPPIEVMVDPSARDSGHSIPSLKEPARRADTGAELSWMPKKALLEAGITPRKKVAFQTATGEIIERDYGYAILSAEGFTTNCQVVFAEETDYSLLGVRTIEGFCVLVDNIDHRFIARPSFAVSTNVVV